MVYAFIHVPLQISLVPPLPLLINGNAQKKVYSSEHAKDKYLSFGFPQLFHMYNPHG